ncbi:MAG TPA: 30S ribosomal protein S17 [Candidatus Magasanikbacteria bacterium]|nr:30S ribosomal protein S17 [Candidatus Magasanikbacteria bacterium]
MATKQTTEKKIHRRSFEGVVASKSGTKTIKVTVLRDAFHPTYHKHYTCRTHFLVHDEKNQYAVGDVVRFVECRPLSKSKRWRVIYS